MPDSPDDQSRIDAFLAALTELSREHGVEIGACGCCGGPYLSFFDEPDPPGRYRAKPFYGGTADYLEWDLREPP